MACVRFWWLGDVGNDTAREEIQEAHGAYSSRNAAKSYGLLPEFGLAHDFDGTNDVGFIHPGITAASAAFSFAIVFQPGGGGMGLTRTLLHTGNGAGYLGINSDDEVVFGVNGGTEIAGTVVEANGVYLAVGAFNGTTGTLYVVRLLEGEAIDVAGPTALTFTNDHDAGDIGSNDSTDYFAGALQGAAIFDTALDEDDVEALQAAGTWIDVTEDVEIAEPVTIDRGIRDDSPLARVAGTGTCTLIVDNSHLNSAGLLGYYSPPHANARAGFDRGTMLRVSLNSPESPQGPRIQFVGKIRTIRPIAGIYRERRTFVLATDWMDELARATLQALPVETDITADDAIRHVVDRMRNRPHDLAFDVCGVLPTVFDTNTEETVFAQRQVLDLIHSEFGTAHVASDGTFTVRSRHARSGDQDVAWTILNAIEIEQERSTEQIKNLVKVTVHPRRVSDDPLTVLYSLDALSSPADEAMLIANAATVSLFFPFEDQTQEGRRIGGADVIEPVPATGGSPGDSDFLMNTAADGSGADVTDHTDLLLEWLIGGTGVTLEVTNNYGQPVYLTYLQIRGRAIYNDDPRTLIAKDQDSIDEHGEQPLQFDMPYQADAGVGQGVAEFVKAEWNGEATRLKATTFKAVESPTYRAAGVLADVGTRVHIEELVSGVAGEYFINAIRLEWRQQVADPDGEDQDDVNHTWRVTPADTRHYFTLDLSELDGPDVLAPF